MKSDRRNGAWVWIGHLCAIGVAGVFLYAAWSKIQQPRQFVVDINNYHIVPRPYTNLFAILLTWWEVGAAVALILPGARRAGTLLIGAMLIMFIGAVSIATYNGYDITCGCFGKHSGAAGWKTIGLDTFLFIHTVVAFLHSPRSPRAVNE